MDYNNAQKRVKTLSHSTKTACGLRSLPDLF